MIVIAFDVATKKIGWSLGDSTEDADTFTPIKSGVIELENRVDDSILSFSQVHRARFFRLTKQLGPIVKEMQENNCVGIMYEMSTHGTSYVMQLLNQYVGEMKAYFWMAQIKKVLPYMEEKTINWSQWAAIAIPDAMTIIKEVAELRKKLNYAKREDKKFIFDQIKEKDLQHKKTSKSLSISRCKTFGINPRTDDEADAVNMASCFVVVNDMGVDRVIKNKADKQMRIMNNDIRKFKSKILILRDSICKSIDMILDTKYLKKDFDSMFKFRELIDDSIIELASNEQKKVFNEYNESVTKLRGLE